MKNDLTNLRKMLKQTDGMMEMLNNLSANEKDIDTVYNNLFRARTSISNILTQLGDLRGYRIDPPKNKNKRP